MLPSGALRVLLVLRALLPSGALRALRVLWALRAMLPSGALGALRVLRAWDWCCPA
jgi:hypothetical protein